VQLPHDWRGETRRCAHRPTHRGALVPHALHAQMRRNFALLLTVCIAGCMLTVHAASEVRAHTRVVVGQRRSDSDTDSGEEAQRRRPVPLHSHHHSHCFTLRMMSLQPLCTDACTDAFRRDLRACDAVSAPIALTDQAAARGASAACEANADDARDECEIQCERTPTSEEVTCAHSGQRR
jgi:hypothetical protein